ncbi:Type I restriction-modification system, DNA- methyltransferase subunit M [Methanosarcina mazei Tuc01]|uniref:Type I restriction-modification system, DNA-methyltransferase subunit M n=1 Tax=Methanosarcina mazei Tuc01 TaxID=1236903 RepID=M1Q6W0_METMZ|nr:type I restriction-modification system subunit M [Methanosarcina mazei]AGF95878.1 Type I restriction-modification system, DNA- methyltransferase subunit M [Methanosarcina mazei Tuc01]
MTDIEQQFLNDLDNQLWRAADKLRSNLDAANYKHVVLGLIFLKYVSDAFEERQQELTELFQKDDDDNIYYLPREDYDSDEDYQQAIAEELEIGDYYTEKNVFWVGQFALAEGKQGGQYYTPKSIVTLIVEMLEPYKGRVYDPAMGSGGFFVSSDKFIEKHASVKHYNASEQKKQISVYGQESNPTTWKLAAMNMVIRGIDFNFGKKNADSFLDDQHPDLRADFVMTNPPFNMKDWWHEKLADDPRWTINTNGQKHVLTPPTGNANFAWMLHMLYHLAPTGSMALLLANGSMSSNTNNEGEIRKTLVEQDLVECMVALPGQLFTNTQIPA